MDYSLQTSKLTFEQYLVASLIAIKTYLHEMQVRHDQSPSELRGHFCTELRRYFTQINTQNPQLRGSFYNWARPDAWEAPFTMSIGRTHSPYSLIYGTKFTFNGEDECMTVARMQNACNLAVSASEVEADLDRRLIALQSLIPGLELKATAAERRNREAAEVVTELAELSESIEEVA